MAVSDALPTTRATAICLNMIVRNEAHIVREILDAAAPYISYWVIVDTGSDDGTPDLIRAHMRQLGIAGELIERPWQNFGHNRTEALELAQGHGDYIWVVDADDTVSGTIDFGTLAADVLYLRHLDTNGDTFWVPQLFRDSTRVHWEGVTHEYAVWKPECSYANLEGDYHIADRHLSARNASGTKLSSDRDVLLAEVERQPDHARSIFYLAQTYWCMGDLQSALKWYARRVELGGWEEEVYFSMLRIAESMRNLGHPWPDVQDAYLRTWEYRPVRAEPLHCLASWCRVDGRYQLGYKYAKLATEIPFPETEALFVRRSVYSWGALDEQAVCASWTGRHPEAFGIWRTLLAKIDVPEEDRQRIASNRDICVPTMLAAVANYPRRTVERLAAAHTVTDRTGPCFTADTTVTVVAGTDSGRLRQTLNTFLNCCLDASRRAKFVVLNTGLSSEELAATVELYPFLSILPVDQAQQHDFRTSLLLRRLDTRYWLHIPEGAQFFAPEELIARLVAVLTVEPQVYQVGINLGDATKLTGRCAPEAAVRRAPGAGRYLLTESPALGPALFEMSRLRAQEAGAELGTACLDEVLCTAI
jgi:hypothetical protein